MLIWFQTVLYTVDCLSLHHFTFKRQKYSGRKPGPYKKRYFLSLHPPFPGMYPIFTKFLPKKQRTLHDGSVNSMDMTGLLCIV